MIVMIISLFVYVLSGLMCRAYGTLMFARLFSTD